MQGNFTNIELEKAVLGYLVFAPSKQKDIVPNLNEDFFYDEANSFIFQKINDSVIGGGVADLIYLNTFEETNISYLMDIQQITLSINPKWIEELQELSIKRKLTETYLTALQDLEGNFARDCVDNVNLTHDKILSLGKSSAKTKTEIIKELDDKIMRAKENKGIQGLEITGIKELDKVLNGAEGGDLITVAARPSVGKSLLASNIASECMKQNLRGLVWSLEMGASSYLERVIANVSNVNYGSMRSGSIELEDEGYVEGKDYFYNSRVEIIDKHGVDVDEIRSEVLRLNSKDPVDVFVVDYGGLIRPSKMSSGKSTNDQFAYISGKLKQLAIELNIPVIMLWQLNREVERRNPSIPKLSDLRDTGAVEQDADKVVFIYRPIVHGQTPSWSDMGLDEKPEPPPENITLMEVKKNRNGRLGRVAGLFISDNMKFTDYDPDPTFEGMKKIENPFEVAAIMKQDPSQETFDIF